MDLEGLAQKVLGYIPQQIKSNMQGSIDKTSRFFELASKHPKTYTQEEEEFMKENMNLMAMPSIAKRVHPEDMQFIKAAGAAFKERMVGPQSYGYMEKMVNGLSTKYLDSKTNLKTVLPTLQSKLSALSELVDYDRNPELYNRALSILK